MSHQTYVVALSSAHLSGVEMPVRHRILKRTIVSVMVGVASLQFANAENMTRDNGSPVGDNENSQTAGPEGPVTLQDSHLIEKLQRFDRERIPERVVHARGTGVFGEFVPTADISNLTVAKVFNSGRRYELAEHAGASSVN